MRKTSPVAVAAAARRAACALLASASLFAACAPDPAPSSPSDDPAAWDVDATVDWAPRVGATTTLLAMGAPVDDVAVELQAGTMFVARRDATSGEVVVSSTQDDGASWERETTVAASVGPRAPRLVIVDDTVWLLYRAGALADDSLRRTARLGHGDWSTPARFGLSGEEPWDAKQRGGRGLLSSTIDNAVRLRASRGEGAWDDVDAAAVGVTAGASQPAFELAADGALWSVLRTTQGGGHGSPVCTAPADDLAAWTCDEDAAGLRVVEPRILRHGDDLYVVAREEGAAGPTLYALDTVLLRLDPLFQLDVGAAVRRTGLHTFMIAGPTDDGISAVEVSFIAQER